MDRKTEEADRALEAFRARRTVEGRFLSYCRGRARYFWNRQILTAVVFPVLAITAGVPTALLALLAVLLGEALDVGLLRWFGRRDSLAARLPLAIGLTTLTGAIQALTVALAVALVSSHGVGRTLVFAGAISLAAMFDAAMLVTAHRAAAIVRIVIYAFTLSMVIYHQWLRTAGTDLSLPYDALSAVFLGYVGWMIVGHVFKSQDWRNQTRMATLEKARELAHANVALEQSRQVARRLALVAERANDSVIITDADGTITWVNRAFTNTSGYGFAEVVGRNVRLLDGPETDPATSLAVDRARADRRPIRTEIVNHRKDGTPIWMEVNMCPLFDDDGGLMCMISIERDIGEAKERERALAEARHAAEDAVRARHNFLATMSHEIRTPMNGVIGTADLLLDTELDERQRMLVGTLVGSGEALLKIVNDILDFSKLEAGRLDVAEEPFSPRECLMATVDLVRPLAEAKGLGLNLVLPASLPGRVLGDKLRLRQVFLNLLGNAIKFTEKGSVQLEVSVRLEGERCHFLVSVRDTGIGIPPERQECVFDSFTQADSRVAGRFGGTGLGLSISRLLLEAMGGEISVASKPGEGTVFCVSLNLPVAADTSGLEESALPPPAARQPASLDGVTVLVAEDNRTNTLLLEAILSSLGVAPVFAQNGRDAVSLFREHHPDVVLMDVHMPILDGLAATREIRRLEAAAVRHPTPVIALTANAFPEDRELCLAAGMDAVVTKPYRKNDILEALERFAARPADAARLPEEAARTEPVRRSG